MHDPPRPLERRKHVAHTHLGCPYPRGRLAWISHLLRTIGELGIVQSTDLDRLFPHSSAQKLRRRLKLLFNAGYLARPRAQLLTMLEGGSKSMIYLLTRPGARLLAPYGIAVKWRQEDWELGQLQHRLAITNVLITATLACRRSAFLEFVPLHELLSGAPAAKYFFLELDRGTMPIVRPSLTQTSIVRKLLAYGATFRGSIHRSRFAMDNMRVLLITESAERVAHMVDAYQKHAAQHAPAGIFLFIDRAALTSAPSLFETRWRDGEGKEQRLFG